MTKIDLRPSGVSLHFTKHKANTSDINGLQRHNERQPGGRHGNKNIDDARTKDNIFLIEDDRKLNKRVEDTIAENRDRGLKGVRQNAVRMVEGTVQLSGKVLDQPEERQIELLKDSFEYLQDTFGKENFVSAVIHLDETTPHLHFDFVPIEDGRLTAKTIISPNRLRKYQADFLKHLQDNYSDLNFQRGTGEYNGLSFEAFKRLKDEEARIEKEQDAREDKLNDREDALDDREDNVKKTEAEQAEKSKNLDIREDKVKDREDKVKKTEAEQAEKSKEQDKRDNELNQKDAEIHKNLQIAFDSINDEVAQRTAERVKELDKREHDVEGREKAVEGREKASDAREKGLDDEVAQRTAERAKELNKKEHDVESREKAVEGREKASDAREKGLDDEVAQRTAERFAEATGMKLDAEEKDKKANKKLADAEAKDKKADKKLADAEAKDKEADKKLSKVNNVWNNIQQALNRIVERIKNGDLKPEEVEDTIEKYNPVTDDNVDDFMLDMNDLVDDNQINL